MAKLTIEQERRHARACQLVNLSRDLTEDERGYVLDHYQPSSTGRSALNRAHFTPEGLAVDMSVHIGGSRIVDLAAGIGRLSFHNRDPRARNSPDFVCIEREPEFVRVGRRVMPEARWICADIMDIPRLLGRLGKFDCAISNPPFGPVLRSGDAPYGYRGRRFEYHAIALASLIARRGVFLVPQAAAPFRYSGVKQFQHDTGDAEYRKFVAATGITLRNNCGIDTSSYEKSGSGVVPRVEIVLADFTERVSRTERLRLGSIDAPHPRAGSLPAITSHVRTAS